MNRQSIEHALLHPDDISIKTLSDFATFLQLEWLQREELHTLDTLLEKIFETLYHKIYPHRSGGCFVPKKSTIGFSHCHFLHAHHFEEFEHNRFWIKFHIVLNTIEDIPETLQPRNMSELIHLLHCLSFIKNSYYSQHTISKTISQEKEKKSGLFMIQDYRLVIRLHNESEEVLINDWSKFPSIVKNKEQFVNYLNAWGNAAMKEIWNEEHGFPSLQQYLRERQPSIRIDERDFVLHNELSNIHITRGLLHEHHDSNQQRSKSLQNYQDKIDTFVSLCDEFDQVFFVGNQETEKSEPAFAAYNGEFRVLLKERYAGKMLDYSPDVYKSPLPDPLSMIAFVRQYMQEKPEAKVLFSLGLHGEPDGSAKYAGGNFYRSGFETLFSLAEMYSGFQLFIVSCWSGSKAQQMRGNVIMSSSDQVSYGYYMDHFLQYYRAGKSLYVSHMLTSMEYQESLLPTSFLDENGETVILCGIGGEMKKGG